jgi:phosphate-selective porin OprO/OprP
MKRLLASALVACVLAAADAQHLTPGPPENDSRERSARDEQAKPAPAALHAIWGPGIYVATADRSTRIRLGARIQQDWSFFTAADRALLDQVGSLDDTVDFRRIWLELDGTFYERIIFSYHLDFAGGKVGVRNMYLGLKEVPYLGVLRIGSQQEPFGLEELTVNNHITFLERALDLFYPSYNVGVLAQRGLANQRMSLSYGAFRETDDSGRLSSDEGYSLTARISGLPFVSDDGRRLIHLGLAGSHRTPPNGRIEYKGRPNNRWAPPFIAATNILADSANLAGVEAAAVWGAFSVQSEWSMAAPDIDGNHPAFSAYYLQVSYFLTGEHRSYNRAVGCFGAITPRRPLEKGGWGAWEVALRASNADLSDGGIEGGQMRNFTAGVNWYASSIMRVMLNVVRSIAEDLGESDAVLARFQLAF